MDKLMRAFYEQRFVIQFLTQKGAAFQDFFSSLMEKRYPGDFVKVRPWGKLGDWKNDGYIRSQRKLFQCYAPLVELKDSIHDTLNKIDKDFNGALPHWEKYFDHWLFVHNSYDGLPAPILKKLLELGELHASLQIGPFGFAELKQEFLGLNETDLVSLFGLVPTEREISAIGFSELNSVLSTIAQQQPPSETDIRPVSPGKIEANALSENVRELLTLGMKKSDLVRRFFRQWYDPTLGDRAAEAFRMKYEELRTAGTLPDDIFTQLQIFAGSAERRSPSHEFAVYAVLAFFFEECDIFEPARDTTQ